MDRPARVVFRTTLVQDSLFPWTGRSVGMPRGDLCCRRCPARCPADDDDVGFLLPRGVCDVAGSQPAVDQADVISAAAAERRPAVNPRETPTPPSGSEIRQQR